MSEELYKKKQSLSAILDKKTEKLKSLKEKLKEANEKQYEYEIEKIMISINKRQ